MNEETGKVDTKKTTNDFLVLSLVAASLVLKKEFLASFLVRGNICQHDNYHNASYKLENFSFLIYVNKWLSFIYLLFEYWVFIISTSCGHLEEIPPLSTNSTFYLIFLNSCWLTDCKNLLISLGTFCPCLSALLRKLIESRLSPALRLQWLFKAHLSYRTSPDLSFPPASDSQTQDHSFPAYFHTTLFILQR